MTTILGSGHAAVSKTGQFIVDTCSSGFNLHDIEDGTYIQTFPTGTPIRRHPKQVAFGKKGHVIVGGSDYGIVYVFDQMTGIKMVEQRVAEQGMVQTVAVGAYNMTYC